MPPENLPVMQTNNSNKIRYAAIAICLAILAGEIFVIRHNSTQTTQLSNETLLSGGVRAGQDPVIKKDIQLNLTSDSIAARSAIVVDLNTNKIIFAKEKDKALPLASITKVMTALVAVKQANNASVISVTPEALAQDGDSGLKTGEKWRLADLIDFTLVSSSNDGAAAIASAITKKTNVQFSNLMNSEATKLGMTNTHFINETGLDINEHYGGSYGSAADVAKMFAHALKFAPEILADTAKPIATYASLGQSTHTTTNTNKIVSRLPGLRASKTGYTDIADGNLAIIIDAGLNQPYAVVVLGSTQDGRFQDVDKIVKALYQAINKQV